MNPPQKKRAPRQLSKIGKRTMARNDRNSFGNTIHYPAYTTFFDEDRREFLRRCVELMSMCSQHHPCEDTYYQRFLEEEGLSPVKGEIDL